ncbi:AMP-binding protein [Yinghuangia soli]|uniref:AMP-binding protein n=1 Tax=Yinghuangia soli TaxID=2908204 RepID=A0AA41TWL8_9ACTN|nr:AMP-binding protein [Yinghuangia soli]MCF2525973.1 AMP-binding protein [Yinghuangia soli]
MKQTVAHLVRTAADRYEDAEAVVDGDTVLSFRQLADEVMRFARAAEARGLEPGDRVAIWAPNSARWLIAALGVLTAGGTVVTVNTRYRGAEAADLLRRSQAVMLFVHQGFLGYDYVGELAKAAGPSGLPALRLTADVGDAAPEAAPAPLSWEGFLAEAERMTDDHALAVLDSIRPTDTSHIIFTSGTTGAPKGVLLHHRALVRLYAAYSGIWGIQEGDRYLVPLPFFHMGGQSAVLSCLTRGAAILPLAVFDPGEVLALVDRLKVSVLIGAPTVFAALLDHPDRARHDLSSLRLAATGAAVVPVRLVERCKAELPFENFITAYGLTECHGTATMCRDDDDPATVAATSGSALPSVEVKVVGPDGRDRPAGEPGEIWVRGYNVTHGYLDDPEATSAAVDLDGWLHTGDIGHLDARGNLAITDRLKDLFIVGGFNVSPAEVEQVMARHPAVSEAAVIGVPDARLGEVGRAYVIAKPGAAADADEIGAWLRERLANFKVPRTIEVVATLPRNATGKVQKTELRAAYRDRN